METVTLLIWAKAPNSPKIKNDIETITFINLHFIEVLNVP